MKINPFFELNGNRYELKTTRWLILEYKKMQGQNDVSVQEKSTALKFQSLAEDVRKYATQEKELWEKFCKEPTEENQRIYLMFKSLSDKAIADYNDFVANNDISSGRDQGADILERIAIKALAEQYFDFNEDQAKKIWESYCEKLASPDLVDEWLVGMAECLFGREDEVEKDSFLDQMRKKNEERANNRKSALRKKN